VSRVIKFRAIIPQRNATIIFTLQDLIEWKFSNREVLWPWIAAGNTPDQFTGITDRNGVEIYEGDIVTANDILCVVEWQKVEWTASWSSVVRGAGRQWRNPQLGFRVHEVIGNIYENSELLEAKP